MSWRSSLPEAPSSIRSGQVFGEAPPLGARSGRPLERPRACGPLRAIDGVVVCRTADRRPRSRERRWSWLVRPGGNLAGLIFGLGLAALLAGVPAAGADTAGGPAGGDFALRSIEGPVNLDDFRGKVVMLFFGYTSCPDICPLSLLRIGDCLSSLEAEQAEQAERVSALFVTLDPGRDTAERMRQYAGFFHPGIVGLTGEIEEIGQVAARYGITWERKSSPESALGYSIAHPDTILLVDAEGVLAGEVRGEEGGEALRAKVLELLARQG